MEKRNNLKLIGPVILAILGVIAYRKFGKGMDNQNKSLDNLEQNLSKNFKLKEFKSRDGAPFTPEVYNNLIVLSKNLQVLRDYVNKPIRVNSGYRSPAYNKKIGGATKSQHMLGRAADITIQGMTPGEVANTIEKLITAGKMQQGGLGRYPNFTQYDFRGNRARW